MEISNELRDKILFILENQKQMYELTLKSPQCNFVQRKGVNMLLNNLEKVIAELN